MPRFPVQLVIQIGRSSSSVGERDAEPSEPSDESQAQMRTNAAVDISWQPGSPRISFLHGGDQVGDASLAWLAESNDDPFTRELTAALEAGDVVTITLRRDDD